MDGPLKNLLVVDLTRVLVGPYCTMILSDLGARVIKIEAPEIGDDSRGFGPFIDDYSAYFMSLNRGKESIALNLKNEEDKKIIFKSNRLKICSSNNKNSSNKSDAFLEIPTSLKEINIAVHSLKDMDSIETKGLVIQAYLERNDPRESFVSKKFEKLTIWR